MGTLPGFLVLLFLLVLLSLSPFLLLFLLLLLLLLLLLSLFLLLFLLLLLLLLSLVSLLVPVPSRIVLSQGGPLLLVEGTQLNRPPLDDTYRRLMTHSSTTVHILIKLLGFVF